MTPLFICDEITDCDHCGKSNLKCTVALYDETLRTDGVVYYGRTCASPYMRSKTPNAIENEVKSMSASLKQEVQFTAEKSIEYSNRLKEIHAKYKMNEFSKKKVELNQLRELLNKAKEKAIIKLSETKGIPVELIKKVVN